MKLNHINLVVTNVAEAIGFFETYFNFKCTSIKGDNIIAILKGEADFTLVIMLPNINKEEVFAYPEAFHIGFMLETQDEVNQVFLKLKAGGIHVERAPAKIRDSFGFYFTYDKVMIEVAVTG